MSIDNAVQTPPNHRECLICGEHNPLGLHLNFKANETGGVQATFQCNRYLQSYDGILHGGAIAAMLDAAMTNCLFYHSVEAVTVSMEIRYLASVPSDSEIRIVGELDSANNGLFNTSATISHGQTTMARASAMFMDKKIASQMQKTPSL